MNEEKIQALAEQANLGPCCESQAVAIKKFAELIVRECMSIVKPDPQDGETIKCILNLANIKLENHFGV